MTIAEFGKVKDLVCQKLVEGGYSHQARCAKYAVDRSELVSYLFGQMLTEKESIALFDQCKKELGIK